MLAGLPVCRLETPESKAMGTLPKAASISFAEKRVEAIKQPHTCGGVKPRVRPHMRRHGSKVHFRGDEVRRAFTWRQHTCVMNAENIHGWCVRPGQRYTRWVRRQSDRIRAIACVVQSTLPVLVINTRYFLCSLCRSKARVHSHQNIIYQQINSGVTCFPFTVNAYEVNSLFRRTLL